MLGLVNEWNYSRRCKGKKQPEDAPLNSVLRVVAWFLIFSFPRRTSEGILVKSLALQMFLTTPTPVPALSRGYPMRRFINGLAVTAGGLRTWSLRLVLIGAAALLLLTSERADGQAVAPSSVPPLARYIPERELAFYGEFEGLNAHAEGARKAAISKLLSDTPLGALLEDLATQVIHNAQQQAPLSRRIPAPITSPCFGMACGMGWRLVSLAKVQTKQTPSSSCEKGIAPNFCASFSSSRLPEASVPT